MLTELVIDSCLSTRFNRNLFTPYVLLGADVALLLKTKSISAPRSSPTASNSTSLIWSRSRKLHFPKQKIQNHFQELGSFFVSVAAFQGGPDVQLSVGLKCCNVYITRPSFCACGPLFYSSFESFILTSQLCVFLIITYTYLVLSHYYRGSR